ncbi:MAG TPA: hypothetical protein DHV14_05115 [Micrococcales bacterium]|nr:hypothetical protein [Micrococcales bacterium]
MGESSNLRETLAAEQLQMQGRVENAESLTRSELHQGLSERDDGIDCAEPVRAHDRLGHHALPAPDSAAVAARTAAGHGDLG